MRAREKRVCQNPNHPFKQDWYWYYPDQGEDYLNSPKYCTSCASHINLLRLVLRMACEPRETLYGNSTITTSKEQLKELIEEL